MRINIKQWAGFSGHGHHHEHGEHQSHAAGGHGHTHGVIDPSISSSERGIWAIKWSFFILGVTAALQFAVVAATGSVALLADSIQCG